MPTNSVQISNFKSVVPSLLSPEGHNGHDIKSCQNTAVFQESWHKKKMKIWCVRLNWAGHVHSGSLDMWDNNKQKIWINFRQTFTLRHFAYLGDQIVASQPLLHFQSKFFSHHMFVPSSYLEASMFLLCPFKQKYFKTEYIQNQI